MFSVRNDNPFAIFRILQEIARKSRSDADMIDLSRGDPGYGFTPSVRGRAFASLVLELDGALNCSTLDRFLAYQRKDISTIEQRISDIIHATYAKDVAERNTALLAEFIADALKSAISEGKLWTAFDVLRGLFAFSPMSGGSYLDPKGEELARIIVAFWHRSEYGVHLTSEDVILTNGVSHGIGTLFKALGEEGCGYLKHGDSVMIGSPVYAPYLSILEERGIQAVTFSIDPMTGALSDMPSLTNLKVLVLIDPNNPTGFSLKESDLEHLAACARKQNMLIITDEVYSSFFPKKKTMLTFASERTITLNARSKIERSAGLRFGEIITLPDGRKNMAAMLGLRDSAAFEQLIMNAKAPGRAGGQFQHTTFVPGPAELLGISHIILGTAEREQYRKDLKQNTNIFAEELALPHRGNLYYILFDLNALPHCKTKETPIEEKLVRLAKIGVIYIPGYQFFAKEQRHDNLLNFVRASVVNTTPERLKEAAKRTKEVLC